MRIGGTASFFAECSTKEDVLEAKSFAEEKQIPLIVLGSGANSVFADTEINALVIRIKNETVLKEDGKIRVGAGKNLAMLINELAKDGLDLSALTGIPGTIGGSIFGNAGQGLGGIWIDAFIEEVTAFLNGEWKTLSKEECEFAYRESRFKKEKEPIIWEAVMTIPTGDPTAIQAEVKRLLQKRIETQPHLKTAGSCFKALPDGTPAWKLIDAAGLRGLKEGGVEISEKHANFLLNTNNGTFEDVKKIVAQVKEKVPSIAGIEMRLFNADGIIDA